GPMGEVLRASPAGGRPHRRRDRRHARELRRRRRRRRSRRLLLGLQDRDSRYRSSVITTLEIALDPWLEPSVARQGVQVLSVFQNLSQMSERWGRDGAETVMADHVARLFGSGIADRAMLDYPGSRARRGGDRE